MLMLSMHMIVYIKVVMSQQLCTCTGHKTFANVFTITGKMSSIITIGTNHGKILTGLKDSQLQNKLAKSKAKNGLPWPRSYRM